MSKDFVAIGLMSGTSLDGIDIALLTSNGEARIAFGACATYAYQEADKAVLRAALAAAPDWSPNWQTGKPMPENITLAHGLVTERHIEAVQAFLAAHNMTASDIELLGFHGQTILHAPARAYTVQIGDGARLAKQTGIDVVAGFRSADMKAGGQGAPLTPLYHAALAEKFTAQNANSIPYPLAVLNLGGVGNVTFIGRDKQILGFDTGPANALIDDWVRQHTKADYDDKGALAATGTTDKAKLAQLLDNEYFALPPPKSLDRFNFTLDLMHTPPAISPVDGAATLTDFTASAVAQAVQHFPEPPALWVVCGGGRHNQTLMQALANCLNLPLGERIVTAEQANWPGDELEAQAFAWLAVRARLNLPLTMPTITGCGAPTTGGVFYSASLNRSSK